MSDAISNYHLYGNDLTEEPDATLLDHLGDVHAALGQLDKAREAWRKSIEIEPNKEIEKKLKPADPPRSGTGP